MFVTYLVVAILITFLGTLAMQRKRDSNDAVKSSARVGFLWPILLGIWLYKFFTKKEKK